MKKDDGIVRKAADVINEKVVPVARESIGKGASAVGEILEATGRKAEEIAGAAGEKTREAGKVLEKKGDKLLSNKNDSLKTFRKEVDVVGQKAVRTAEKVVEQTRDLTGQAVTFTKNKAEEVGKAVRLKKEDAAAAAVETKEIVNGGKRRKTVVRTAAGVAVLTATAAAAYAYYQKRREEEEAIKAEFSEKMKKWNELDSEALAEAGQETVKMRVRPTRIYNLGKNAQLGDEIIVNISYPGENVPEFNPDEVADPINTMDEFRRKAEELAGRTGESARLLADNLGDKARDLGNKAKDLYQNAQEMAEEFKERHNDKQFEIRDEYAGFGDEDLPEYSENKASAENLTEDTWKAEAETLGDAAKGDAPLEENRMESDKADPTPDDNLIPKEVEEEAYDGEDISWQEDESILMQRTADLRRRGAEGFQTVKEKFSEAKDFVVEKYNQMKPEEEEELPEDFFSEEYQVTIHNRGNKDYFFSPMLIQRYDSRKRMTAPVPSHEEGTTLEQRIIKPGETYSGRLVIKMTANDDALIMFEDMLMKNSVAVILEEDLDDQFLYDEAQDLNDDLLFEGIEEDGEGYDLDEEELTELDLEDLELEKTEEIDLEAADEDPANPGI